MLSRGSSEDMEDVDVYGTFPSAKEQLIPPHKSVYDEVTEFGS